VKLLFEPTQAENDRHWKNVGKCLKHFRFLVVRGRVIWSIIVYACV